MSSILQFSNPVKDKIKLAINNNNSGKLSIKVLNLEGKIIMNYSSISQSNFIELPVKIKWKTVYILYTS